MKELKCPECEEYSTSDMWDIQTKNGFGVEVMSIEEQLNGYYFICPKCKEYVEGLWIDVN